MRRYFWTSCACICKLVSYRSVDIFFGELGLTISSFAFQFLLAVYSHIEGHNAELEKRILETLIGHLEQVFLHIEEDDRHCYPGILPSNWELERARKHQTFRDKSLQIIKAKKFATIFLSSDKIPSWFLTKVDGFVEKWVSSLRESDSRDYCVFPASDRGDGEEYYLRDHVLIWEALEITEVLEKLRKINPLRERFEVRRSYLEEEENKRELSLGVYTSGQARRSILKRFTTRNTMTNERMLATYRNAQDNSFLVDTLDTILFYDEHRFFYAASRKTSDSQSKDGRRDILDEWIRTLNIQARHARNDHEDWREPLQYALAIQMARHGHQIDSRPASEIFDGALKVLLQSCSASGIFPGFLTREQKFSANLDAYSTTPWCYWDSYWHTSFELPYILWDHAKERLEGTSGEDRKQSPPGMPTATIQGKTSRGTPSQTTQSMDDQELMPKFLSTKTVLGGQDFTDQKNIFEISDEWLVPCPEFLHFDPRTSFHKLPKVDAQRKIPDAELRRLVIDIPKRRNQWDDQTLVDPQPCNSEEFFERLRRWRTKKANMVIKKRIIWLSSNDEEAATICPVTVPDSEQLALTGFFRRHSNRDKHYLDDPSASNNSWKTELQLSFYQLANQDNGVQSKPEIALAKRIRRDSMGFRFNGDFFDCYWTCHIINFGDLMGKKQEEQGAEASESTQKVEKLLNDFLSGTVGNPQLIFVENRVKKCAWHQRRILELILFEKIIRRVTAGTQEILEEIKHVLASTNLSGSGGNETMKDLPDKVKETILFSDIDGNAYFSFSAQWEVIQQLLQVLDEDLSDTAKKIENWQDREKNRGTETPRWTKKDEKRYRPALRRIQLSNAESVQGLLQLQEKVQSLRASLISRRDYIRDDLSLRGAENTRYFTYVTVVFLPLGFATGIFSMSETPAGSTLARMSGTAATTFVLTIITLYFIADVLEALKKWKAALAKPLGIVKEDLGQLLQRVKGELERLLRPLLGAVGRLMGKLFNGQQLSSLQDSNDGGTGLRESAAALSEGLAQERQTGPAPFPDDEESQIRSHPSVG